MGIGIQREPSREVAQHARDGFDIHTVLQCNRSVGVAEVVESDLRDAGSCQHSFQHIVNTVRRDGDAVGRGEILSGHHVDVDVMSAFCHFISFGMFVFL